jgi:hypothetical protein
MSIALAQSPCGDLPLDGSPRLGPARMLTARAATPVATTRDMEVLALHNPALAHVGAPRAVTKCEADEGDVTRRWARALRAWFPAVGGFRYRPRPNDDGFAWVFFDDGHGAKMPRRLRHRAGTGLRTGDRSCPQCPPSAQHHSRVVGAETQPSCRRCRPIAHHRWGSRSMHTTMTGA